MSPTQDELAAASIREKVEELNAAVRVADTLGIRVVFTAKMGGVDKFALPERVTYLSAEISKKV